MSKAPVSAELEELYDEVKPKGAVRRRSDTARDADGWRP
jgi:hypothetical protein